LRCKSDKGSEASRAPGSVKADGFVARG
jgi:hypothetical protein